MNVATLNFRNAPIVEAVLDIDCDSPPGFDLSALEERARALGLIQRGQVVEKGSRDRVVRPKFPLAQLQRLAVVRGA